MNELDKLRLDKLIAEAHEAEMLAYSAYVDATLEVTALRNQRLALQVQEARKIREES